MYRTIKLSNIYSLDKAINALLVIGVCVMWTARGVLDYQLSLPSPLSLPITDGACWVMVASKGNYLMSKTVAVQVNAK